MTDSLETLLGLRIVRESLHFVTYSAVAKKKNRSSFNDTQWRLDRKVDSLLIRFCYCDIINQVSIRFSSRLIRIETKNFFCFTKFPNRNLISKNDHLIRRGRMEFHLESIPITKSSNSIVTLNHKHSFSSQFVKRIQEFSWCFLFYFDRFLFMLNESFV